MDYFLEVMEIIRTHILEKFILPGIGVSYWSFLIGLLVAGIVITVLINAVRASSSSAERSSRSIYKLGNKYKKESN